MEKTFVGLELKAGEGIRIKQEEREDGIIVIEAVWTQENKKNLDCQQEGPVPEFVIPGAVHVSGSIESNDYIVRTQNGDFFTYIPRNNDCEPMYVSTYEISWDESQKRIRSIPGVYPLVDISRRKACNYAEMIGGTLLSNLQWNSICLWMVNTGAMTIVEVYQDSTKCGNYSNNPEGLRKLAKTGSNPKWMHNGIDNFTGNTACWTGEDYYHVCGGGFFNPGSSCPASYRDGSNYEDYTCFFVGFRVVFTKKHCEAMK